ncbi:hypothetical protein A3F65_04295 [Candidatus Saccharibacteria bacterium RIFCSPHIGHO2_12_FULL_47_16b]|nr:MAG: hypothetical protein A3F65_04295 [Candidatus Saccharibacteria bacterium RIFCSPHIGHO2_12_FULL_47_16b]OGL40537.1 MAG: hypothetical protein A3J32_03205 [Candidatus Saccharibacteria bacterium RIFCSPLOWO2_02_FULL_46_7]
MRAEEVGQALRKLATTAKAKVSAWFFKSGPGQYAEGDKFLGVTVPEQRKIAKQFGDLDLVEVKKLVVSPWHEERLTGLFILVDQYKRADDAGKKTIASFYHKNRAYVNNWDLVDSSAPYILGDYLTNHSRAVLVQLAKSKSIWDRRIAMLSTAGWISQGDFTDAFKIIDILIDDKHDLIQKAVGWMLREIGKNAGRAELEKFLDRHAATMPRTTLRYAVEHFEPQLKTHYMGLAKMK